MSTDNSLVPDKGITSTTFDDIAEQFGKRVEEWVAKLTPLYPSLTTTDIRELAESHTYREFSMQDFSKAAA